MVFGISEFYLGRPVPDGSSMASGNVMLAFSALIVNRFVLFRFGIFLPRFATVGRIGIGIEQMRDPLTAGRKK